MNQVAGAFSLLQTLLFYRKEREASEVLKNSIGGVISVRARL
jgi:hypothetical protein